MCVEYCVKISYKSDNKWKSCRLYNLSTLTLLPVVIFERATTHLREDRGWGDGVMYCFSYLVLQWYSFGRFWHVICKENRTGCTQHLSITPAFTERGCKICTPLAWLVFFWKKTCSVFFEKNMFFFEKKTLLKKNKGQNGFFSKPPVFKVNIHNLSQFVNHTVTLVQNKNNNERISLKWGLCG